ncbi:MAG: HIT family protein [Acholeplasmataceae bacterium]|jgi:histidine triad (HIT) family protein|nr:HIT family protein [Acholeplasmataceae bacterium]
MSTIFTKIIKREIPANIIYEDDLVIAFLDISQATLGHTLVVTKREYENIFELDDKISAHLYKVVVKLSKAINKAFNPSGLNILNNNGQVAGQTVFHYHIHIIPRYNESDVNFTLTNNYGLATQEELEKRCKAIQSAL